MLTGSLAALSSTADGVPGVVLGKHLAAQLDVALGDEVEIFTVRSARMTPAGVMPRPRRARVVGTFSLGLYEFDHGYAFVTLELGQRLAGVEDPQHIQVKVEDIEQAPAIARRLAAALGPAYQAEDWQQMNKPLFSALWLEKMGLSIAIGLIVAVAALNIIASLILLVMEKSRDIAILKTMGLSSERVMKIFMLQGLIIGLVGTAVGGIGGVVIARVLDKYQLIHIADGRVSGCARPVRHQAVGPRRRAAVGDRGLLPGDDLSVSSGVEARPGAGAQVRVARRCPSSTVRSLNKTYHAGGQTIHVLRDLDLDVARRRDGRHCRRVGRRQEHAAARPWRARSRRVGARRR